MEVDTECKSQRQGTSVLKGIFRTSTINSLKLTMGTALILILILIMDPLPLGENRNNLLRSIMSVDMVADTECKGWLQGISIPKGIFRNSAINSFKLTVSSTYGMPVYHRHSYHGFPYPSHTYPKDYENARAWERGLDANRRRYETSRRSRQRQARARSPESVIADNFSSAEE